MNGTEPPGTATAEAYLAGMAQELVHSLTLVSGSASHLTCKARSGYTLTCQDMASLQRMRTHAGKLRVFVEDLFDLSGIGHVRRPGVRPVAVDRLIRETVANLALPEPLRPRLEVGGCDDRAVVDPARLCQALGILITNTSCADGVRQTRIRRSCEGGLVAIRIGARRHPGTPRGADGEAWPKAVAPWLEQNRRIFADGGGDLRLERDDAEGIEYLCLLPRALGGTGGEA